MTCIVATAADGKVTIGGDSAGSSGYRRSLRADEKGSHPHSGWANCFATT